MKNSFFRYARNIPEIDTILPDGSRFHIMQGSAGISEKNEQGFSLTRKIPLLTIRLFSYPYDLTELVKDKKMLAYLSALPKSGHSMIVSGNQGAGKTTLLNALIGRSSHNAHVIIIEEAPEMQPQNDGYCVRLWNQGDKNDFFYVDMIRNTKATLRMTGDVMIIGEIRDENTLWEFLRISNVGLSYVATTIHSNSAADTLSRLISLGIAVSHHPPREAVVDLIRRGISHIIHLRREGSLLGIDEIVEIEYDQEQIENTSSIRYRTVFKRDEHGNYTFHKLSDRVHDSFIHHNIDVGGFFNE